MEEGYILWYTYLIHSKLNFDIELVQQCDTWYGWHGMDDQIIHHHEGYNVFHKPTLNGIVLYSNLASDEIHFRSHISPATTTSSIAITCQIWGRTVNWTHVKQSFRVVDRIVDMVYGGKKTKGSTWRDHRSSTTGL